MATLKDVAELAGVSASTVSYVLNGKKTVRPDTLKRIEDAIEKLNYCPNLLASSLKTNRTKTIGVVVSDLKNIFFVDVLAGIEEELAERGYCMTVCNSDNSPAREEKCLRGLSSRNIDGLILIGTGDKLSPGSYRTDIPIVCIDRVSADKFLTVRGDNVMGGYLGTKYLIDCGCRRILFLGSKGWRFSRERYQGYERAMIQEGLQEDLMLRELDGLDAGEACQLIQSIIREGRQFDAVFGCTDYIAIGALKGLIKCRIPVPEQIGVMGYDDIAPASFTIPELTTVAQPKREISAAAVKSLMCLMEGKQVDEGSILLEPRIVERESCKRIIKKRRRNVTALVL